MASTLPIKEGTVDSRRAIPPATWGPAIDVPLAVVYALSDVFVAERVFVPGAEMSGFTRLLPSTVTGPRLLKLASVSVLVLRAPVLNTSSWIAGGSLT
jgi:hypothetical protein